MSATVAVAIRVPVAQIALLRKAAKARGLKLATYVREVAIRDAEHAARSDYVTVPK